MTQPLFSFWDLSSSQDKIDVLVGAIYTLNHEDVKADNQQPEFHDLDCLSEEAIVHYFLEKGPRL